MMWQIPKMEREMSGRNLDSFLEDASAFDALSDDDKARLFAGESLEGETDAEIAIDVANEVEDSSATPDAGTVEANEETTAEQEPVVQAKDGKHTIPFSELEAARERARQLEQEVLSLKAASQPPVTESAPAVDANAELRALIKEQNEALIMTDTDKAAEIGMKIMAIQQDLSDKRAMAAYEKREAQKQEKADQETALTDAQARANAMVDKYPFLNSQSPDANSDAIELVIAKRDQLMAQGVLAADAIEQAVAKVAPLFEPKATKPSNADVAQKAAEAISKAKAQVPTSLSQVPAGAMAHHDEGEAIRNDTGLSLINRFNGKSPEEIERIINRVI